MLWRDADFLKLWAGHTISLFGSQISFLALPLTAIVLLEATPSQMGILSAVRGLPALVIGLFVGVWVDRYRRRPLLIASKLGRGMVLLAVPVAALAGLLSMGVLYAAAFVTGALSLFFGVANQSYLPALVGRKRIVEANSRLELSRSAAEIAGPGAAGALVQWLTAPAALICDAISCLASALLLGMIRAPEPAPAPADQGQNIWQEARNGVGIVLNNPSLRAIAGCIGTLNLFNSLLETVWLLYLTQNLQIEPGVVGVIFAGGSVGFLVGAVAAERFVQRLGMGRAMMAGLLIAAGSDLITPLASGEPLVVAALLMFGQFGFGIGMTTFGISQISLRQTTTPDHQQGRMNAVMQVAGMGVVPVGALVGGLLGETIGLRSTLLLAAAGEAGAVLWLLWSPLRSGPAEG